MNTNKDLNAVIYHKTDDGWQGDILIQSTFIGTIGCPVGWIKNSTVETLCIPTLRIQINILDVYP